MELHRGLNALAQQLSTEQLDGAHIWGVSESDRPLIRAFMRGVRETAHLKFGHPGLETVATRSGRTLLIQNDIGTNDAHVLVIRVERGAAELIYSDLHPARFAFFGRLAEQAGFAWQPETPRVSDEVNEGHPYLVGRGRLATRRSARIERALAELGARLVFVIDWNRARKQLGLLVAKPLALSLLEQAARQRYGHMGWLLAGGAQLVFDAMQAQQGRPFGLGDRLDDVLGHGGADTYLAELMRKATEALLQDQPPVLVADEARLLLARAVRQRSAGFDALCEHAAFTHALADSLERALEDWISGGDSDRVQAAASQAKQWERRADDCLVALRGHIDRGGVTPELATVVLRCDDVADDLEEAHFLLELMACGRLRLPPELHDDLRALVAITVTAVKDWVRVVELARLARQYDDGPSQERAVQRLWQLLHAERRADMRFRDLRRRIMRKHGADASVLALAGELAATIERATDALLVAGHTLRATLIRAPGEQP